MGGAASLVEPNQFGETFAGTDYSPDLSLVHAREKPLFSALCLV